MKALLLRVGIDKGSDGVLGPIFTDGSFIYIPISEKDEKSGEKRTFHYLNGREGELLSFYLPPAVARRRVHFDPEFSTFTYADRGVKARYLLQLEKGDYLVFYAGLNPYQTDKQEEALYLIGFFMVDSVWDFSILPKSQKENLIREHTHNSHLKRFDDLDELVLVVGDDEKSQILDKAVKISSRKPDRRGRHYHVVSPRMENLLGIKGSIQRSIPPRFIRGETKLKNLKEILGI